MGSSSLQTEHLRVQNDSASVYVKLCEITGRVQLLPWSVEVDRDDVMIGDEILKCCSCQMRDAGCPRNREQHREL